MIENVTEFKSILERISLLTIKYKHKKYTLIYSHTLTNEDTGIMHRQTKEF